MAPHAWSATPSLYAADGARKYLNRHERQRLLDATTTLPEDQALYCLCLAYSGGRVSEVLGVTAAALQLEAELITLRTLKRRKLVMRELPLPPWLILRLDRYFGLSTLRRDPPMADQRLWPWHRVTAWRLVRRLAFQAGITGRRASPRGLRHAMGVLALARGAPLNIVQKWLGHARMSTTAIYASACGPEEVAFAARFWDGDEPPRGERVL